MVNNMSNINKSIVNDVLGQYTYVFDENDSSTNTKDLVNPTADISTNVYQLIVKDEFSRIVFFSNWEDLGISVFENKTISFFNTANDSQVDLVINDDE